jgi:chemotaxis methyl-accepting protein methylase
VAVVSATAGTGSTAASTGHALRFRDRVLRLPKKLVRPARVPPTTRDVFGPYQTPVAQQDQLETEFFERVVLPNGTIKTTKPHRLDDLNQAALPFLTRLAEDCHPLRIMDVGISSGVSTIEWHEQLAAEHISCDLTGTDLTVYASLMSLTRHLGVLVDRNRNFLHLDAFGHGASPTASGLRGIFAGMVRGVFRAAMKIDRRLPPLRGNVGESAKGHLLTCEPVTLLTRKFPQRDSVRVIEEDLLAPERPEYRQAFHVVRAANVLNRIYFNEATLTRIADKLKQRLKPGGLLIVCRTTSDGANHASIFECIDESRLRVAHRLGGGSEIEDLLVAV